MIEPASARRVAAVVLVLAFPVAVAWLIGDLSTTDDPLSDHVLRPPDLPAAVENAVGAFALVAVVGSAAMLVWSWRRDPPDTGFLSVLVPLLALGAVLGLAWRVMTAAVIGANIGAGLLVFLGSPVVLGLVVFAAVSAWVRR